MIKLLITDFDGTLVDTFEANYGAYERAFKEAKVPFTRQDYRRCFGFRFDRFMEEMNVMDKSVTELIREAKGQYYPEYFHLIRVNKPLVNLLASFRSGGGKTAVASTARRKNLMNVLSYLNLDNNFDLILAGEDVQKGKPSPDIYLKVMSALQVPPQEALIFEDSEVGFEAAQAAGVQCIKIIL